MPVKLLALFLTMLPAWLFSEVGKYLEPLVIHGEPKTERVEHYIKSSALVSPPSMLNANSIQFATSQPVELDRKLIEQKLGELLSHRYQASGKVSIFLTREWRSISVGSNFLLKIIDCMPDELTSSSFIRFSIWDKGSLIGNYAEPIKMAHYVDVFFSKQQLNRGARLDKSMFSSRPVDILKQYAGSVPVSAKLSGYQLSSTVKTNSPIRWNNLSKLTLVQKGKVVDVYASGNGIYVTMKGMALENGVEGGVVRIKNLSSDKIFQAKVLTENSVKVHL